jgi:molybdopterin biosynthesis enzyme
LVVSIPPKVGPSKSLYRYSNLRENFTRKFIEISMRDEDLQDKMKKVDAKVNNHVPTYGGHMEQTLRSQMKERGSRNLVPEKLQGSHFLHYLATADEGNVMNEATSGVGQDYNYHPA